MFQKKGNFIYNTATVINPQGEIVGRYSKMFPFYPYEVGVTGGDEFLIFDVPNVGRFGVTICYDMWFPETSRTLAVNGVEVILHPTLTATIDRDIELALVQATAATNQCFIFDINGLGDGGTGRSIICGPDGRVLHQASTGEELIPIEIDIERVKRSREMGVLRLGQPLKSFRDRKIIFDIYREGVAIPYLNTLGQLNKPTRLEQIKEVLRNEDYTAAHANSRPPWIIVKESLNINPMTMKTAVKHAKKEKPLNLKHYVNWFEIPAYNFDRAVAFYNTIYQITMESPRNQRICYGILSSQKRHWRSRRLW